MKNNEPYRKEACRKAGELIEKLEQYRRRDRGGQVVDLLHLHLLMEEFLEIISPEINEEEDLAAKRVESRPTMRVATRDLSYYDELAFGHRKK